MSTQSISIPPTNATTPDLVRIGKQTFVALTTFRKSGVPVTTPMNLVEVDGRVFFRTYSASGKARRLARNPDITLSPSDFRGNATGGPIQAVARRLDDADEIRASRALRGKYPVSHRLIPLYHRLRGWKTYHYEIVPKAASDA